jgi:uncharacterized hydrophobic protein (TIGR00271 family)
MSEVVALEPKEPRMITLFRDWIARKFGVGDERKEELYLDLSKSTTLTDPSYWLQTLFAAGIATLGLVLNSPAVIIGAMLISPLMGPILACGLALATGDVILGFRSVFNLVLSCLVAVGFSFLLVAVLPFKEITNEIAVRTHPNTLDLAVAFFSGAIGSIAICKEVKGVVTSIPGVAIAVALMPPLGVVGYGVAIAFSLDTQEGMRVALGGGLLFLTNLVAITFTAMIVFLVLHIDVAVVKGRIEEWHRSDEESLRFGRILERMPGLPGIRRIGTLPGRLLMIIILLLAILIPLSRSFNQLKQELSEQQKENRIRQLVTETWQKEFGKLSTGETRSFLDHAFVAERDGKLTLQLRVLTSKPLTTAEKEEFNHVLEASLGRSGDTLETEIVEIPTAAAAVRARAPVVLPQAPPSVAQLQGTLFERIDRALAGLYLPPPAKLIDYQLATGPVTGVDLIFSYISDRDIEPDAQALIQQDVRNRLDYPQTTVRLSRVPVLVGRLVFRGRDTSLDLASQGVLDNVGGYLKQHARLRLTIVTYPQPNPEQDTITPQRLKTVKEYLSSHWQVADDQMIVKPGEERPNVWSVNLALEEAQK